MDVINIQHRIQINKHSNRSTIKPKNHPICWIFLRYETWTLHEKDRFWITTTFLAHYKWLWKKIKRSLPPIFNAHDAGVFSFAVGFDLGFECGVVDEAWAVVEVCVDFCILFIPNGLISAEILILNWLVHNSISNKLFINNCSLWTLYTNWPFQNNSCSTDNIRSTHVS